MVGLGKQKPVEEARTRTVASMKREAAFVPETKRGYELLREMQREKQHMRMVIDEYGGVAGVVTIEDLLEAIVGSIADEHDEEEETGEVVREAREGHDRGDARERDEEGEASGLLHRGLVGSNGHRKSRFRSVR